MMNVSDPRAKVIEPFPGYEPGREEGDVGERRTDVTPDGGGGTAFVTCAPRRSSSHVPADSS